MPRFFIEQVALCPRKPAKAIALLTALGLESWVHDNVHARGEVFGEPGENKAALAFNYDATRPDGKPLEVEVLHYTEGPNWMDTRLPSVSHLGMHCTAEELAEWRKVFADLGYKVAQEVLTQSHDNPAIAGLRWYQYVIFDTYDVLGVDLKFIVRRYEAPGNEAV